MNSELKKTIKLEKSWLKELGPEFELSYMQELKLFLQREKRRGKKILPEGEDMFKALNLTPLDKVKVVILGQDPYHGAGQEGVRIPPSLQNIFKELQSDLGLSIPSNGCLESWAEQGVLLLNSILSVEKGLANSHSSKGWELFTDSVISMVNEKKSIVFMLWGGYAAQKGKSIDSTRHLVLKSVHPSPLSAHRGFFGNRHFSKCNQFLESKSIRPIDWKVYKSVNT